MLCACLLKREHIRTGFFFMRFLTIFWDNDTIQNEYTMREVITWTVLIVMGINRGTTGIRCRMRSLISQHDVHRSFHLKESI